MRTKLYRVAVLVLIAAMAAWWAHATDIVQVAPASQPEKPFPIPIITLRGDSDQIGGDYGKQLAEPIRIMHDKYLRVWLANGMLEGMAMKAAKSFEVQLLPHHLKEIQAMARQLDMDERQVMLANCFLDLIPMFACSTISLPPAASPDGVARLGRNLDFASLNVADKQTVLLIFHPKDYYSFAAVSWPGLIGVLSGMNEHGLTLVNMEVRRSMAVPRAMPYTLLYRMVLERCKTVDEAVALLEKTPRQTANNLMLMDAQGNRAVVEITPEAVTVRKGVDGKGLFSTNHQRAQDTDTKGRCWRYDALNQMSSAQFGKIDVPAIERMLGRVSQGKMTLQSMVFEPANRVLWLSAGADAAHQEFHRLELTPYFKE